MKSTKMTMQRLEKKYLLDQAQYDELMIRLYPFVREDEFGSSTICNIYYDTLHFDLITRSLQKPAYKEKLRLRSYGVPKETSTVYLEIKKKCAGVVNKRRIAMKLKEAEDYLSEGEYPDQPSQILNEIDYFLKFYEPTAKLCLSYDRSPYVALDDPEIRITFDKNIRRRYDHLSLFYGDYGKRILEDGKVLMEIKVSDAYPLWLTHLLSELAIYPMSFSKYGTVFMEDVVKEARV